MADEDSGNDGERSESGDDGGDRDPFDALDADEYRDRQGNPFDTLGGQGDDRAPGPDAGDGAGSSGNRWSTPEGDEASTRPGDDGRDRRGTDVGSGDDGRDRRETDVGSGDDGRDRRETDVGSGGGTGHDAAGSTDAGTEAIPSDFGLPSEGPFSGADREGESPFESGTDEFEEVDVEDVDADEVWESLVGGDGTEPTAGPPEEVEVSKHSYCEGCEYFSSPPDVHCNHEGTEILEFVDMRTVRVVNCPVVAKRRELEQE